MSRRYPTAVTPGMLQSLKMRFQRTWRQYGGMLQLGTAVIPLGIALSEIR